MKADEHEYNSKYILYKTYIIINYILLTCTQDISNI